MQTTIQIINNFFQTVNSAKFCRVYGINQTNLSLLRNGKYKGNSLKFTKNILYCMDKYIKSTLKDCERLKNAVCEIETRIEENNRILNG